MIPILGILTSVLKEHSGACLVTSSQRPSSQKIVSLFLPGATDTLTEPPPTP
jgi:hypothetical protein